MARSLPLVAYLLDQPVQHGGDAKRAGAARCRGYIHPFHRQGLVGACQKCSTDRVPMLTGIGHEVVDGHVVNARRSLIGLYPFPCLEHVRARQYPFQQVCIRIGLVDNAPVRRSPGRVRCGGLAYRAFSVL
jgi:hypothetical protein